MEVFGKVKQAIKYLISPLILYFINMRNHSFIEDISAIYIKKVGRFSMIRKGSEITSSTFLDDYSYISGPRSYVDGAIIGKYCSIARQVTLGVKGHNYHWVTTSPIITSASYKIIDKDVVEPSKGPVIIGNDVWIGMNANVLGGGENR